MAAVDPQVESLGWYLLPLVLLSTALTLITSLLVNNIQRQYPIYWWTPAKVGRACSEGDIEKASTKTAVTSGSSNSLAKAVTLTESTYGHSIRIAADDIMVPDSFDLTGEERSMLEIIQDRLRNGFVRFPEPSASI